jgi:hypothetical protein
LLSVRPKARIMIRIKARVIVSPRSNVKIQVRVRVFVSF